MGIMANMNRRSLLGSTLFALAGLSLRDWARSAHAQQQTWRHGSSLFGDLKYPAGFKRFDYVYPNAPKGGRVRELAIGTFDNFNFVVAGVKGALAGGIGHIYDRLGAST